MTQKEETKEDCKCKDTFEGVCYHGIVSHSDKTWDKYGIPTLSWNYIEKLQEALNTKELEFISGKTWEISFDKRFVDKIKDINGGLAYTEWIDNDCVEQVKTFIQDLLTSATIKANRENHEFIDRLQRILTKLGHGCKCVAFQQNPNCPVHFVEGISLPVEEINLEEPKS